MAEKDLTTNYSSDWITRLENRQHWVDYWFQQKLLEGRIRSSDRILELGLGSGFTANYLRSRGYKVTTLDIDVAKRPDVLFNLALDDFSRIGAADVAMAFEVLEHMPYDRALAAVRALRGIGVAGLFVSLPLNRARLFEIVVKIRNKVRLRLSITRKRHRVISRHHWWELDYREFSVCRFVNDVRGLGFSMVASEVSEETLHRYFYFSAS